VKGVRAVYPHLLQQRKLTVVFLQTSTLGFPPTRFRPAPTRRVNHSSETGRDLVPRRPLHRETFAPRTAERGLVLRVNSGLSAYQVPAGTNPQNQTAFSSPWGEGFPVEPFGASSMLPR
jgi:hypothetical protein